MSSIGMIINAAKECGCCVFADVLSEEMSPTGVLIQETRYIVDEATDDDERAGLCLLLE